MNAAPARAARSNLVVETRSAEQTTQRLELELFGLRDRNGRMRVLLRVDDPPDLHGAALLALERADGDPEIYSYLPNLRSVRRITGRAMSGSLFGSDLSYEDVLELYAFSRSGKVQRDPDEEIDGRPAYVVTATPDTAERAAYVRITTRFDREHCILRDATFYDRPDHLAKRLEVPWDKVVVEGTHRVPQLVIARNYDRGTETHLSTTQTEYSADLPESLFTTATLEQGR